MNKMPPYRQVVIHSEKFTSHFLEYLYMAHGHIGTTITSKREEPRNVKVYRVYEKTVSWPECIGCSRDMSAVTLMTNIVLHQLQAS